MLKKSVYIILFIALTGCASYKPFPETTTEQDGANTIHVYLGEMDYDKAFRLVSQQLSANNFSITYSDKDLGVINSDTKRADDFLVSDYRINAMVQTQSDGLVVIIKGKSDNKLDRSGAIENIGMSGSPIQAMWEDMNRFAQSLNGKRITYSRQ